MRRFPQIDFDDRKALAGGEVEDQLGDVLGRRIGVDQIQRLAELLAASPRPDPGD